MYLTDVVDVGTLQRLNWCLEDVLGMAMTVVDASGVRVASHHGFGQFAVEEGPGESYDSRWRADDAETPAEYGVHEHDGRRDADDLRPDGLAVPIEVGGQRIATWYIGEAPSESMAGFGAPRDQLEMRQSRGLACSQACGAVAPSPCPSREGAVALVSMVARVISDAASANLRMADELSRYSMLALRNAAQYCDLQRVANTAPVGIIEVSREGDIAWTNQEAELLLGMTEHGASSGADGPVCTVASIDGAEPAVAYARIARRLVRGETVRGIRCVLCRPDGASFTVRVDATPDVSDNHRLERVTLALLPEDGTEAESDDSRPSWNEVRALLNVVNTKSVTKRADIAQGLQNGVVDVLRCAWIEFDSLRQEMARKQEPAVSGCLDAIAFQLQEATANATALASTCWPNVWDHHGVASAIECRLSDMESQFGVQCSFKDRSNGRHSLDTPRCSVLYHVAEELLANVADHGQRADVVLDANEHYWLLVVSADTDGQALDESGGSVVPWIREELRPFGGTVETIPRDGGRIVQYVIMPAGA